MEELPEESFPRIRPLLPEPGTAGHVAFVHGVVDRRMAGRIFVDSAAAPTGGVILSPTGFYFVFGAPCEEAFRRFVPTLLTDHLSVEQTAIWATSREWESLLDSVFEKRTTRKEFTFPSERRLVATPPPPPGTRLVDIDQATAERFGDDLDPWVIQLWGGPAEFPRQSFGKALLRDDVILSFCCACAIGGGEAEVEIGSAPGQRRRGFATLVALAFLHQCAEGGLRAAWSCAADNIPSDRLARRLGFRPIQYIAGYPLGPAMREVDGRWSAPARTIRRRRVVNRH